MKATKMKDNLRPQIDPIFHVTFLATNTNKKY